MTELYRLAAVRGTESFGLSLLARNLKHALARAKSMLADSGYHAYPLKD